MTRPPSGRALRKIHGPRRLTLRASGASVSNWNEPPIPAGANRPHATYPPPDGADDPGAIPG